VLKHCKILHNVEHTEVFVDAWLEYLPTNTNIIRQFESGSDYRAGT